MLTSRISKQLHAVFCPLTPSQGSVTGALVCSVYWLCKQVAGRPPLTKEFMKHTHAQEIILLSARALFSPQCSSLQEPKATELLDSFLPSPHRHHGEGEPDAGLA